MKGDVYVHKVIAVNLVEITNGDNTKDRKFRYYNGISGKFETINLFAEEIVNVVSTQK